MAKTYTPEQIEDMRAAVNAADQAKAEADLLAKETFYAPLKAALDNEGYRAVFNDLHALETSFDGVEYPENDNLRIQIKSAVMILANLASAAGVSLTPMTLIPVNVEPEA